MRRLFQGRVGAALSGGGARGMSHLGVLKALQQERIVFDLMAGNSIGALVAAVYAVEPDADALLAKAREILATPEFAALELFRYSKRRPAGVKLSPLRRFLTRLINVDPSLFQLGRVIPPERVEALLARLLPDVDIRDTRIPLTIVAVDLCSGDTVSLRAGPLRKAVQASIAIPGIFPWVPWNGRLLVDGGLASVVPVRALVEAGADIVLASVTNCVIPRIERIPNNLAYLDRVQDIMVRHIKALELLRADVVVDAGVPDDEVDWVDFDRIEYTYDLGYRACLAQMPRIREAVATRSPARLWRRWVERQRGP